MAYNVKSYTDVEQAKVLAKILPHESADMSYMSYDNLITLCPYNKMINDGFNKDEVIPCWSLASLIGQMPSDIKGHELTIRKSYWQIEKTFAYELSYEADFEDYPPSILISASSIEFVDACFEMIVKLKEKNLI